MTRSLVATASAIIMSAALLAAQSKSTPSKSGSASQDKSGTVTYTGCIEPGATSSTFVLTNAKAKGASSKSDTQVNLTPATPKVSIGSNVTHEVEITGTLAPAGASSDLPTLTVTKVSWRADYCG